MRVLLLALIAISSCASVRAEDSISLYGSFAALINDAPLGFAMIDARLPITSRVTGSVGLAHVDPSGSHEEQQVRLSLTAAFPGEKYLFDDRLLWVRSDTNTDYWRNRWRLFLPMGRRFGNARWLMFDEIYYNESRGLFRNFAAAGVSLNPLPSLTTDVVYSYIDNRGGDVSHGVLVMLSMRFH